MESINEDEVELWFDKDLPVLLHVNCDAREVAARALIEEGYPLRFKDENEPLYDYVVMDITKSHIPRPFVFFPQLRNELKIMI